jgi:cation diffusion facilitator CzcD-associated flavoprotein CzcO
MRVAVIGAGPSGLTACKTLREAGLDATCFEAGSRVGGQWVIDNSSGTSAAYHSLRTNTNRAMSRFSDFTFPDDYPEYPSHAQMADWLEAYARRFGVLEHVRFGARVARIDARECGEFWVHTQAGTTESFDAVVVATGNLWDPVTPKFSGSFEGPIVHAKHYRDPESPISLTGKSVLVVGLGNSGCEIAVELCEKSRVLLSARSGQLILPRVRPGDPAPPNPGDPPPALFRLLPPRARDALFRAAFPVILRRIVRKLPKPESVGLPPAPRDPFQKRAVVNDHVLDAVARGAITAKPDVRALRGRAVEFVDGSLEPVDAIVCATGYRFTLPFLTPEILGVSDPSELRLYQGIAHTRHRRLFFVGVLRALCSIWPYAEQQARWIAACLAGRFQLPPAAVCERRARPILSGPLLNCQFRTFDLQREARLAR